MTSVKPKNAYLGRTEKESYTLSIGCKRGLQKMKKQLHGRKAENAGTKHIPT